MSVSATARPKNSAGSLSPQVSQANGGGAAGNAMRGKRNRVEQLIRTDELRESAKEAARVIRGHEQRIDRIDRETLNRRIERLPDAENLFFALARMTCAFLRRNDSELGRSFREVFAGIHEYDGHVRALEVLGERATALCEDIAASPSDTIANAQRDELHDITARYADIFDRKCALEDELIGFSPIDRVHGVILHPSQGGVTRKYALKAMPPERRPAREESIEYLRGIDTKSKHARNNKIPTPEQFVESVVAKLAEAMGQQADFVAFRTFIARWRYVRSNFETSGTSALSLEKLLSEIEQGKYSSKNPLSDIQAKIKGAAGHAKSAHDAHMKAAQATDALEASDPMASLRNIHEWLIETYGAISDADTDDTFPSYVAQRFARPGEASSRIGIIIEKINSPSVAPTISGYSLTAQEISAKSGITQKIEWRKEAGETDDQRWRKNKKKGWTNPSPVTKATIPLFARPDAPDDSGTDRNEEFLARVRDPLALQAQSWFDAVVGPVGSLHLSQETIGMAGKDQPEKTFSQLLGQMAKNPPFVRYYGNAALLEQFEEAERAVLELAGKITAAEEEMAKLAERVEESTKWTVGNPVISNLAKANEKKVRELLGDSIENVRLAYIRNETAINRLGERFGEMISRIPVAIGATDLVKRETEALLGYANRCGRNGVSLEMIESMRGELNRLGKTYPNVREIRDEFINVYAELVDWYAENGIATDAFGAPRAIKYAGECDAAGKNMEKFLAQAAGKKPETRFSRTLAAMLGAHLPNKRTTADRIGPSQETIVSRHRHAIRDLEEKFTAAIAARDTLKTQVTQLVSSDGLDTGFRELARTAFGENPPREHTPTRLARLSDPSAFIPKAAEYLRGLEKAFLSNLRARPERFPSTNALSKAFETAKNAHALRGRFERVRDEYIDFVKKIRNSSGRGSLAEVFRTHDISIEVLHDTAAIAAIMANHRLGRALRDATEELSKSLKALSAYGPLETLVENARAELSETSRALPARSAQTH